MWLGTVGPVGSGCQSDRSEDGSPVRRSRTRGPRPLPDPVRSSRLNYGRVVAMVFGARKVGARRCARQSTRVTGGGSHVPLRAASSGQYSRMARYSVPSGEGSQFALPSAVSGSSR